MLTVMIATRNRAGGLPRVLAAFARLEAPSGGWKLVVVDNGSTDTTRDVLRTYAAELPLVPLFEPEPGKNAALNHALEYLDGDLAVFTDDDVLPRPDWLVRLRAAADDHREYSLFGGPILPHWESPPPEWVAWVPMGPVFAVRAPSAAGPTDAGTVFGPNMAIRADLFRNGTRFDASMGPRGAEYPMGSEAELLQRLARKGYLAWHVQDAVVEHLIRGSQLDKRWALRRAVRFGRGEYRLRVMAGTQHEASLPWRMVPRIVKRTARMVKARLSRNESAFFAERWELNAHWGNLVEAWLMRRAGRVQR